MTKRAAPPAPASATGVRQADRWRVMVQGVRPARVLGGGGGEGEGGVTRPLAIDLFSGLGGWAIGLAAAGWDVIRFDLEDMCRLLGEPYPEHSSLVIQNVLTLHGSQFKNVGLIVSSSPCQEFSYRAMPWKRAKALGPPELGMELFHAQFRIQREASEAAGRHIPMVVENVRGAIPWVGRSRANYGSYHLWGDVPALLPIPSGRSAVKVGGMKWYHPDDPRHVPGQGFNTLADRLVHTGSTDLRKTCPDGVPPHREDDGRKVSGFRFDGTGRSFQTASVDGMKAPAGTRWFNDEPRSPDSLASSSSSSPARKVASAKIAKIPRTLSEFIGRVWLP